MIPDLSSGLCVGDLRFTDKPNAEQVQTCDRCPVRALCPSPTMPVKEDAPENPCQLHSTPYLRCSTCRTWMHTYDHPAEWVARGRQRTCAVCIRRTRRHKLGVQTTSVPWPEVIATLDRFDMGGRYSWGLIVTDLGTNAVALHRRFIRRGMKHLADQLMASDEWRRAA